MDICTCPIDRTHMTRTGPLSLPDVYLVADIRTVLPPVPDVVKLPVVAVEREVRELAEVRQVTAVPLVFEHVRNTAQVIGRVRRRRCRAGDDEFEAKRHVGEVDRRAGCQCSLSVDVSNCEHRFGLVLRGRVTAHLDRDLAHMDIVPYPWPN